MTKKLIILLAIMAISIQARAQESTTNWSLEFGSHYTGLQDYYLKAAEFDRGKEGFMPNLGLSYNFMKQKNSLKFDGQFYDPKRMSFNLSGESKGLITANISYRSYYRQLQGDLMANLEARESGNREGTKPGGKIITHEDKNPGADYGFQRQELQSDVKINVPGTDKIKILFSQRSIMEHGTEQNLQINHCANCHINSRAIDLKRNTHDVSAGLQFDLGAFLIIYQAKYRMFKSEAGPYEAMYDTARHPVKGTNGEEFASRMNFSGEVMPIALYPEIERLTHNLKLKGNIGKNRILAQYTNFDTQNKNDALHYKGNRFNVKLIRPVTKKMKAVVSAGWGRFKNDPIFIDLAPWRDGRAGGGQNFDWTRYSNLTRTEGKSALDLIYQPSTRYRLTLSSGYSFLERDDYPYQGANDKTSKISLSAAVRYRPSLKITSQFKYTLELIDNPFAPYKLMFESSGRNILQPEPGAPAVFYYQRDDLRYGDITSLPTMVHAVKFDLRLRMNEKTNIKAGIKVRMGSNSDEPELDLQQTMIQPHFSLQWHPADKIIFQGNYSYLRATQNGLAAVAMMDG